MPNADSDVPQLVRQDAMTAAQAAAGGAPAGGNTPVTPVEVKCDNSPTDGETTETSGNWVTQTKNFIKLKSQKNILQKF